MNTSILPLPFNTPITQESDELIFAKTTSQTDSSEQKLLIIILLISVVQYTPFIRGVATRIFQFWWQHSPIIKTIVTELVLYYGLVRRIAKEQIECDEECQHKRRVIVSRITTYFTYNKLDEEFAKGFFNVAVLVNLFFLQRLHTHTVAKTPVSQYELNKAELNQRRKRSVPLPEVERIMKLATAIYGTDIVNAAQINRSRRGSVFEKPLAQKVRESVCRHAGVCKREEILAHHWKENGKPGDVTNYVVVVDHERKQIILSIRGTLSIADMLVDLEGIAFPFAGGLAHVGVARMARGVWSQVGSLINNESPQDYELILTGHSLGAGVASLLTIMILHERLVPPAHKVHCLAFAPPPVFYNTAKVKNDPLSHITAYVHNDDVSFCPQFAKDQQRASRSRRSPKKYAMGKSFAVLALEGIESKAFC